MKRREIAECVILGRQSAPKWLAPMTSAQPTVSRIVAQYRANHP
jgi:hypothetical protein